MKQFDSAIIGGGPAGLSCSIYLARFNRSVLVLDNYSGRSTYSQINENYLGFPKGIEAKKLRMLGEAQAKKFGVQFIKEKVKKIYQSKEGFIIDNNFISKTLVFATGVADILPTFSENKKCLGRSMFWCITCDGYKTVDKNIVTIGNSDEAAITTLQFLNYTKKLTLLTNDPICTISQTIQSRLKKYSIPLLIQKIKEVTEAKGYITGITLENGKEISTDIVFNLQGSIPCSQLACELGVKVDNNGYILVDSEQRTNIPFIYAAGDVTQLFSHQVVTAAHEGSMAAQAVNYDLYIPDQRH